MRNLLALFLILCMCLFIGCLGMKGTGGSLVGPGSAASSAILSGRVYFLDRQLYGGIPVTARDLSGQSIETVLTDSAGNFGFKTLPPGIYPMKSN